MNIQDIIDNLKLLQIEIEWDYSPTSTCYIAITEAIQVLQRHVPQVPINMQEDPLWGYCPNCTTPIYQYQNPNACKFCLQRVNWNKPEASYNKEETK